MTAHAYISRDFPADGVAVHLILRNGDDYRAIGQPAELVFRKLEDGDAATYTEPTLRLPEDIARALLDALAAHFGGTSEVQTLRKDYVAERGRVDRMIDAMTAMLLPPGGAK